MNRMWRHNAQSLRRWVGICLVLLLTFAPPLNLAGIDFITSAGASSQHQHHGQDHSGPAHHSQGDNCLQCQALGGMSLAGAAQVAEPARELHAIAAGWAFNALALDSRSVRSAVCRGPPALA